MPFIQVGKENSGKIELYYEDHGSGEAVVLIHGFPFSGAAWEKQVPALLQAGYRAITYDRRGFGKSSQPTEGYDYDTFVADLDQLLTQLDLRGVTLVGHSMGTGEVAHYIGKYGSSRIKRAVFISPIPPILLKTEDNPEGVDRSVFEGFQKLVVSDRPAYLRKFLSDFYNADVTMGKTLSEEAFRMSWNLGVGASPKGTYDCIATWLTDFRPDLPKIDVPALIIQGTADRILPYPVTGQKLKSALKRSRLVAIDGGSHGISWTHADVINKELISFLKEEVEPKRSVA